METTHVLSLTRQEAMTLSSNHLQSPKEGDEIDTGSGTVSLTPVRLGQAFLADIEFGAQRFQVAVDTGSSDTWLAGQGFQCINISTGAQDDQSNCLFGSTYTPSPTFKQIKNQYFDITYGDGAFLSGTMGREVVTFGGITVKNQQVAIVDTAGWDGDGVSSGILGLAFPALTKAYISIQPSENETKITYSPLLTSIFNQGLTPPLFSLAINNSGGLLAMGGLPPGFQNSAFTTAPFQLDSTRASAPTDPPRYSHYIVNLDGLVYSGAPPANSSKMQAKIDSGTTFILLPDNTADTVNALFDPPAVYNTNRDIYIIDCMAKPLDLGVQIANKTFFIKHEDMILHTSRDDCMSGINRYGNGTPILGDVFLKNVLAVFDVGASEMRFTAR